MGLNKGALKQDILDIITDMRNRDENSDDEFATRLSTAIDTYVKTAVIVYQSGLTAPNGAVTGTFQGNLE
ncbi:hypothetical protein GON26_01340 [Flavobacterium sp. GA093]|uniref:Uncharacterized protein n=1 Tax=Flavobacterium hydrocarbonoxydans TaxID=2683249 RepID=A0A6I4NGH3_9FLAO|nr:hypothetical protein [Flavobacterium hydrocarbonoxydans]MWB92993.1 hypothetical protein [Flavobacterium hydrocarbonoxydans]